MLTKELAYYRTHFREAVQKDGVICLECGSIFKYLPGHLCKHNLSSQEYKAKRGYNRTSPLERLAIRRKKRRNALAMKLAEGGFVVEFSSFGHFPVGNCSRTRWWREVNPAVLSRSSR